MFCNDGIVWTNKIVLASVAPYLRDSLDDESCLILPDFTVEQFTIFHSSLLSSQTRLSKTVADTVSDLCHVLATPKLGQLPRRSGTLMAKQSRAVL